MYAVLEHDNIFFCALRGTEDVNCTHELDMLVGVQQIDEAGLSWLCVRQQGMDFVLLFMFELYSITCSALNLAHLYKLAGFDMRSRF